MLEEQQAEQRDQSAGNKHTEKIERNESVIGSLLVRL